MSTCRNSAIMSCWTTQFVRPWQSWIHSSATRTPSIRRAERTRTWSGRKNPPALLAETAAFVRAADVKELLSRRNAPSSPARPHHRGILLLCLTVNLEHSYASKSHGPGIELAERILDLLPESMSKVLFNNSGSEANDTAIKLVWYYNNALGRPQKKKIVSRIKAYHGVTIASASLTGLSNNHRDFDLPIPGIVHTGCPHHYRFAQPGESEEAFASRLAAELDALIEQEGPDTVAAFIAEPVMGAGGVLVPPPSYFDKIQPVLKKHDVLLIVDEVICGFGRLGTMFGLERFDIKPDMVVMAKQLTSGYQPMSATVISGAIYDALVQQSEKIGVFAHGL